jgi:hypothetical protein
VLYRHIKPLASNKEGENRILRKILGPKRDEVTGGWRKLHNELCDLYSSPRIITSPRMGQAGHVVPMGGRGPWIGYSYENRRERDH